MPDENLNQQLGATVAAFRRQRGLDQSTLAAALGVSQAQASRLERGENTWSVAQMVTVAEALGVPATALLPGAHPLDLGVVLSEAEAELVALVRRRDPKTGEVSRRDVADAFRLLDDILAAPK